VSATTEEAYAKIERWMAANPGVTAYKSIGAGCGVDRRTVKKYLTRTPSAKSRSIERKRTIVSDIEERTEKAMLTEAEMMLKARLRALELLLAAAERDDGSDGAYSFLAQRAGHAAFQHGEMAEKARVEREAKAVETESHRAAAGQPYTVESVGWKAKPRLAALPKPDEGAA